MEKCHNVRMHSKIKVFPYSLTNNTTADPLVVWDAFKAFVRGYLTSAINTIKKNPSKALEELETGEQVAESNYSLKSF